MLRRLFNALVGVVTASVLIVAPGAAYADVIGATGINCGGLTNAQLVNGSTVTATVTINGGGGPGLATGLVDNSSTLISNVVTADFTGNTQTVTYTLTGAPPAGYIAIIDGPTVPFAVTCPAVSPQPVPTMNEWAMILLGLLLATGAAFAIERRRVPA